MSEVQLQETASYAAYGLDDLAVERLSLFADLLAGSLVNITAIRDGPGIERLHFLDSLALLDLPEVRTAGRLVDVGSGGGLPAVVLAIALPGLQVVAVESVARKCAFIEDVGARLGLGDLTVVCSRAEDVGRSSLRQTFDAAVSRAVAALPVVAEISAPLVRVGGSVVFMKGRLSDQERMSGERALAILGASGLRALQVWPFPEAENRWLYVADKTAATPLPFPRRPGLPEKRPLGEEQAAGRG